MDLNGAKGILKSLADGVDPLTGEVLPEDHICNQPEIIRAIYMVLMELSRGKQKNQKMMVLHGQKKKSNYFAICSTKTEQQKKFATISNGQMAQ